jgi:hypothetical protein
MAVRSSDGRVYPAVVIAVKEADDENDYIRDGLQFKALRPFTANITAAFVPARDELAKAKRKAELERIFADEAAHRAKLAEVERAVAGDPKLEKLGKEYATLLG